MLIRRRLAISIALVVGAPIALVATAVTPTAHAQPAMPDLRSMSGRPLPVPDLPPGTVIVRLARQMPANAAADIEVVAITQGANGDNRSRTAKSGADGRASFEGIAPGSQFSATAVIDGERLQTAKFPVPQQGGTRVMLIAGLGAAVGGPVSPPPGGGGGGDPHAGATGTFRMGAPTGDVAPAADLPAGTLELFLKDANDRPLAGQLVRLGEVRLGGEDGASRQVQVHDAMTDAQGKVVYKKLDTGETAGFAAVSDYEGSRISTVPFRMPPDTGLRGNLLALKKTSSASVLSLDPRSKIVIDLREEALAVMIALVFRNGSRDVFDAGEDGLFIPLPEGAVGAQEIEGGEALEIVAGKGIRMKTPIPPDTGASNLLTARFGYVLPSGGESRLEVNQVLPAALADPYLLVPANTGLSLTGPGIKSQQAEVDTRGEKVLQYTAPPVPSGGTLAMTVEGIPARDRTGRTVAAVLSLALVALAIALSRGRQQRTKGSEGPSTDELVERRERTFAELVEIERQRKAEGTTPQLDEKRREIVARLEAVYKELSQKG